MIGYCYRSSYHWYWFSRRLLITSGFGRRRPSRCTPDLCRVRLPLDSLTLNSMSFHSFFDLYLSAQKFLSSSITISTFSQFCRLQCSKRRHSPSLGRRLSRSRVLLCARNALHFCCLDAVWRGSGGVGCTCTRRGSGGVWWGRVCEPPEGVRGPNPSVPTKGGRLIEERGCFALVRSPEGKSGE